MLERLFPNPDVRQRVLAGPMGPYLEGLVSNLTTLGYCQSQAIRIVRTASAFGDWLEARGLNPADVGRAELEIYMNMQGRNRSGRIASSAIGCTRLPELLGSAGIHCKGPESPADPTLDRFQEHLANVRGLATSTQQSYRYLVRPLVLGLCEERERRWAKLTSDYVSNFVLAQTAMARAQKGPIVSAVRAFLRFLIAEGMVPSQLIRAIPRVRRWRYADLPKNLSAAELETVLKACHSREYGSRRNRDAGDSADQAGPDCKDASRSPDASSVRRWAQRRVLSL